jgi:hypothetical protein
MREGVDVVITIRGAFPSWTAATPLPPAAPSTARRCPALSPPRSTSPIHAVMLGIQNPAATASSMPGGAGKTLLACARASAAKDPLPLRKSLTPSTRVPIAISTPGPTAVTVPTNSCPGVNGSGGVKPAKLSRSLPALVDHAIIASLCVGSRAGRVRVTPPRLAVRHLRKPRHSPVCNGIESNASVEALVDLVDSALGKRGDVEVLADA